MSSTALLFLFLLAVAQGRLLSTAFGDDMVLSATNPRLYGWTLTANTQVVVSLDYGAETVKATSGSDGLWTAELKPRSSSFALHSVAVSSINGADQPVDIQRVLFGDVFLCGGQSNMASIMVRHADDGLAELLAVAASDPTEPSPVIIAECGSRSGQRFDRNAADGSLRSGGLCLDITTKGKPAMQVCNGKTSQKWVLDDKTLQLRNAATLDCLAPHIEGWAFQRCNDTGADVEMQKCSSTGARYQHWSFVSSGNRVVSEVSKRCLTVTAGPGAAGEDGGGLAESIAALRIFRADLSVSDTPSRELAVVPTPWTKPAPSTIDHVASFSAVCWFFGRHVAAYTKGPVGLVESAVSGTYVEAWSSPEALSHCPCAEGNRTSPNLRSVLWNAMMHPLRWMSFRGATWYQGESNINNPACYACTFPALISDWRMQFKSQLPFAFVQLAARDEPTTNTCQQRISQTAALQMPKVGMATAIDLGDVDSPYNTEHPRIKRPIGRRLALALRHFAFNDNDVRYLGPTPESFVVLDATTVNVTYSAESVGDALLLHPRVCQVSSAFCGAAPFELQDAADGSWHIATTKLAGKRSVLVTAISLQKVGGLRYIFAPWPTPVIYNSAGLPGTPFVHSF